MLLHSKILGESSTEVLILHGFLGSGDNWLSVARELCKKNIKVHLIDQRNHGRSFHAESFNYDDMCNDLLYYIKYYKITKIILNVENNFIIIKVPGYLKCPKNTKVG